MATTLAAVETPSKSAESGTSVSVTFKYPISNNWVQAGIAAVHHFLSALGFSAPQEVAAFCSTQDVLGALSDYSVVKQFVSDADRELIRNETQGRNQFVLAPNIFQTKSAAIVGSPMYRATYEDLFQVLFTWLTHGHTTEARKIFVEWWAARAKVDLTSESFAVRKTPLDPTELLDGELFVLVTFKKEVDNFLAEYRKPKPQTPLAVSTNGPFVDGTDFVQTRILRLFLTESQWTYVSGNEGSIGVNTGIAELGVNAGGGHYYVFRKSTPKEHFPLIFGQAGVTGSLGASTPISVAFNPAALPSAGKLYQGWSKLDSASDLSGIYLYVSSSAGLIANLNASLIFFLPSGFQIPQNLSQVLTSAALTVAQVYMPIVTSKAVMSLAGHGLETALGIGGGIGFGYVRVGNRFNVK